MIRPKLHLVHFLFPLALVFSASLAAQPQQGGGALKVGTKEAAPFSMKGPDGSWTGISVELWEQIARDLDIDYEFIETDLTGLVDGLVDGRFDVAVAALTLAPEREVLIDYTYPFYRTGLTIAVHPSPATSMARTMQALVSWQFVQLVGALILLLFVVGALVWLFERRHNPEQFGGSAAHGLGSAFWWSAVTMTTVGYGDKAPMTVGGRLVALVWMFTAVIVISSFTAAITSVVTVSRLESPISGVRDLYGRRLATVGESIAARYLVNRGINAQESASIGAALDLLADREVEAVVYDAPILNYLVNRDYAGRIGVLDVAFAPQDYAIGLPEDSRLREPINRALLEIVAAPTWRETIERYFGPSE